MALGVGCGVGLIVPLGEAGTGLGLGAALDGFASCGSVLLSSSCSPDPPSPCGGADQDTFAVGGLATVWTAPPDGKGVIVSFAASALGDAKTAGNDEFVVVDGVIAVDGVGLVDALAARLGEGSSVISGTVSSSTPSPKRSSSTR